LAGAGREGRKKRDEKNRGGTQKAVPRWILYRRKRMFRKPTGGRSRECTMTVRGPWGTALERVKGDEKSDLTEDINIFKQSEAVQRLVGTARYQWTGGGHSKKEGENANSKAQQVSSVRGAAKQKKKKAVSCEKGKKRTLGGRQCDRTSRTKDAQTRKEKNDPYGLYTPDEGKGCSEGIKSTRQIRTRGAQRTAGPTEIGP